MPTSKYTTRQIRNFQAKVSKIPTETGCLEWTASLAAGYGHVNIRGKNTYAHRFAWELKFGPIPSGMFVCHHCDNKLCTNVEHLFLGTQADNMRDRDAKGRGRNSRGKRNSNAILNEALILEMRSDKFKGWTQLAIAKHFGISGSQVHRILHRQQWAYLDGNGDVPISDILPRGERRGNAKLTKAQVLEMRGAKFEDWTQLAIAKHFGISSTQVGFILRREEWAHLDSSNDAPIRSRMPNKLTAAQVLEIRSEKYAGWKRKDIAVRWDVTPSMVSRILNRKSWTHI